MTVIHIHTWKSDIFIYCSSLSHILPLSLNISRTMWSNPKLCHVTALVFGTLVLFFILRQNKHNSYPMTKRLDSKEQYNRLATFRSVCDSHKAEHGVIKKHISQFIYVPEKNFSFCMIAKVLETSKKLL